MMKTIIYYFSGTGNSLIVAKELQKSLPGAELKAIVKINQNKEFRITADVVGFVFPNFCLLIPIPVRDFLEKADFTSAEYLFGVSVRGGSESLAFDYMNQYLHKQSKKLNAAVNITMAWNHPVGKENLIGSQNEQDITQHQLDMKAAVSELACHIQNQSDYHPQDKNVSYKIPKWMKFVFGKLISHDQNYRMHAYMYQDLMHFYADDNCTGCGICADVCLSNKIQLENGHPVWKEENKCLACFACINYCPVHAIQIKKGFAFDSHTTTNPRYHHPDVSYKEIASQK